MQGPFVGATIEQAFDREQHCGEHFPRSGSGRAYGAQKLPYKARRFLQRVVDLMEEIYETPLLVEETSVERFPDHREACMVGTDDLFMP